GTAWSSMTSNTSATLRTLWGTATEVFAGGSGVVMHYDGVSWAPMTLPAGTHFLQSFWGTANNNVYMGGFGEILHWDGTSWTVQVSNLDFQVAAISGNGPSDIYAAGSLGGMVHFDGVSWSPVRVPTTQSISAIAATPTRVFVAGV